MRWQKDLRVNLMYALPLGSTIGIIGGGQLGRMMAQAAIPMGYKIHIYNPEEECPAQPFANRMTIAPFDDQEMLQGFADAVDVITFEFENIPHTAIQKIEDKTVVHPNSSILAISQHRVREKSFVNNIGIPTTRFEHITSPDQIRKTMDAWEVEYAILKTTQFGYDGKGQVVIDFAAQPEKIWQEMQLTEAILEDFVDFVMEVSVIVARGQDESIKCLPAVQNIHKNHILDQTIAPAPISEELMKEAEKIGINIAKTLELVGLIAIELFVTSDDRLLFNEMAPRPHNSGHWSMDGAVTSQFQQSIRAVTGNTLGNTSVITPTRMINLIGDEVQTAADYLKNANAKLHLYGKKEIRPGRKMGHVNILNF